MSQPLTPASPGRKINLYLTRHRLEFLRLRGASLGIEIGKIIDAEIARCGGKPQPRHVPAGLCPRCIRVGQASCAACKG